ncbi:hypothetical protein FRB94_005144 [Tulasnella sp. JGI-2019a]|nr:hypothetical protein FRB94_005144 [Tulasnella sp. JGI-2019a]KAG9017744.1 hypothetical protein FRB93_004555 [Tulasnella sp. JGI-2019a]KAG9035814.1 hypothetical protein FRB95_010408 [Tulasnella sp. JGI-2019a]
MAVVQVGSAMGALFLIAMDVFFSIHGTTAERLDDFLTLELVLVAVTVGLNLSITMLIILKLWSAGQKANNSIYKSVIIMLVESGVLYLAVMIAYMVSVITQNVIARIYITGPCNIIIGIAPTLIVLQLSYGILQPGDTQSGTTTNADILFARPNVGLEACVTHEGFEVVRSSRRRSRTVSLDYGRHCQSKIPRIQAELRGLDLVEKLPIIAHLSRLEYHEVYSHRAKDVSVEEKSLYLGDILKS